MNDISMRYFSRDIGLQKDRKFIKLRRKYGYWAVAVYEELLCLVYGDKGYYIEYTEDTKDGIIFDILNDFQGKFQPSADTVEDIISGLVEHQLFSGCHFKLGYITSHRIQEQFYRYTVDRKNVEVDTKIWMLTEKEMTSISARSSILSFLKSQSNFEKIQSNFTKNQSDFAPKESKENEIKVKESKVNVPPSLSDVKKYAESIHSSVDPERFYNHYNAQGWKIGYTLITDWKAKFREWNKTEPQKITCSKNSFNSYGQRSYSEAEFDEILKRRLAN